MNFMLVPIYGLFTNVFQTANGIDEESLSPIKVNETFTKLPLLADKDIPTFRKATENHEEFFLFFYADWCPACQDFKSAFNLLSENEFFENNGVTAYRVPVEGNPELTARFFISSLPTLLHIRDGLVRDVSRQRWKLIDYFEEKQWGNLESRSNMMHPFGLLATLLGHATRYGYYIAKKVDSINWPKWKWYATFFVCFLIAWAPVVYLGIVKSSSVQQSPHLSKKND